MTWAPEDRAIWVDRAALVRANRGERDDLAGARLSQDDRLTVERRRDRTADRNIAKLGYLLAAAARGSRGCAAADVAPSADVAPPELVELSAEALAVDGGAEVVADDDEPEPHPVSTKAHRPAAPAPPAQSTVRRREVMSGGHGTPNRKSSAKADMGRCPQLDTKARSQRFNNLSCPQ